MPEIGERMLIRCEGGPAISRLVTFPPPLEVSVTGGLYVLVDEDERPEDWFYRLRTRMMVTLVI